MMRAMFALAAAVCLLAPLPARAAGCPANATKASFAVWPPSTIPSGRTVSTMHPCGRRLTCVGGIAGAYASRRCRWR
jgi:hypothetical protein